MLLLSDNDILVKLGLLGLLPNFIELLELKNEQIYITSSTIYSLPNQLKKYTKNQNIYQPILDLVNTFSVIDEVDNMTILVNLSSLENIDSGEAILATKLIENSEFYIATGDKRFLQAIQQTAFSAHFQRKVYTFEICLLLLCQENGYACIKEQILQSCLKLDKSLDGLFRLAFKTGSMEENDIACLLSYSRDIQELLVKI